MGRRSIFQKAGAILCSLLLISFGLPTVLAQATGSAPAPAQAPPQLLTADQLDTLVAPVALYPDPLLSQVLAASTYPLEVVEAEQWLQQNENLHGQQLMDAAKRRNWDPSVQALAAFPTALRLLNNDISWTTDLGNAFLAQQADVMAAIQRMRVRAQASGKLASTPQQVVTTQTQGGQSAVIIQPANPDVMYVPIYSPYYVWGLRHGRSTGVCGIRRSVLDSASVRLISSAGFLSAGPDGSAGVGALTGSAAEC